MVKINLYAVLLVLSAGLIGYSGGVINHDVNPIISAMMGVGCAVAAVSLIGFIVTRFEDQ